MNENEVKMCLKVLAANYSNFKIDDPRITVNLWMECFKNYDYQEILTAIKNIITTTPMQFAPTIGMIINHVHEETEICTSDMRAWTLVSDAMSRSTYNSLVEFELLPKDVQRAVGSAQQLKQWATTDNLNLEVVQSNFRKSMGIVRERMKKLSIQNRINGQYSEMISAASEKLSLNAAE